VGGKKQERVAKSGRSRGERWFCGETHKETPAVDQSKGIEERGRQRQGAWQSREGTSAKSPGGGPLKKKQKKNYGKNVGEETRLFHSRPCGVGGFREKKRVKPTPKEQNTNGNMSPTHLAVKKGFPSFWEGGNKPFRKGG